MRVKVSHSPINVPVLHKATLEEVINPSTALDINIPDSLFDRYQANMLDLVDIYEAINTHVKQQPVKTND